MPWHAAVVGFGELVLRPVVDLLEVEYTVLLHSVWSARGGRERGGAYIVEVLPGPHFTRGVVGVHICQWMLLHVPAAETQIQPARERDCVVDDDDFLMVRLCRSAKRPRESGGEGTHTQ